MIKAVPFKGRPKERVAYTLGGVDSCVLKAIKQVEGGEDDDKVRGVSVCLLFERAEQEGKRQHHASVEKR